MCYLTKILNLIGTHEFRPSNSDGSYLIGYLIITLATFLPNIHFFLSSPEYISLWDA